LNLVQYRKDQKWKRKKKDEVDNQLEPSPILLGSKVENNIMTKLKDQSTIVVKREKI
jgi:hypothetical protein